MKSIIRITAKEPAVIACTDIVYAQRKYWCESAMRPLKMSLVYPRYFFEYDPKETLPLIVWICGGGFTEVNHNVWLPELTYFAKHGYAVASIEYSTAARTKFPQQIIDIKEAIRFIRANAGFYHINSDKIAVMGESAGGYFAAALGVLGETREYDQGDNLEYSSRVQTVISWYGALDLLKLLPPEDNVNFPRDLKNYLELSKFITEQTPPFLLLHGTKDSQVDYQSSVNFYEKLQEKGIVSDLILLEDAEHADAPFVQDEIKNIIMEFIKKNMK